MIRPAHLHLLKSSSTHKARHGHRSLLSHLRGTYALLRTWRNPPYVCIAGLFHSIYGTRIYRHKSISPARRPYVRRLIGRRAERLVHLFATLDRLGGLPALSARVNGGDHQRYGIDATTARQLVEIECANLLDQRAPARVSRLHDLAQKHPTLLSTAATSALERRILASERH